MNRKHKLESLEKAVIKEQKIYSDEKYEKELSEVPKDQIIHLEEINEEHISKELCMKVNRYIKTILKKWEAESDDPIIIETKKSLFPILVKLRKNLIETNQLISILTIFYYLQRKEYLKSNESYMKLSIGNTAWPIGLINVSIHSRTAQVKMEQSGANIMIDEITRKWITSIKRLITFMEKYSH